MRRILRSYGIILGTMLSSLASFGQLYITEFQASNLSTVLDPGTNYLEWVEIYNSSSQWINLDGYSLTDNYQEPGRSMISSTSVGPGEYLLIWLDSEDISGYCDLNLDPEGDHLALYRPDGSLVDSISFGKQPLDVSYGRYPSTANTWYYFSEPTPASANRGGGIAHMIQSDRVGFSLKGGLYQDALELNLSSTGDVGTIRYTTDGSWPQETSSKYIDPLLISETSIIRARQFEEGKLPSTIVTQTYIMDEISTVPVISIVANPEDFFSGDRGIYVEGWNGIIAYSSDEPANWNNDWERPVNFEYFSSAGEQKVNQLTGTKIAGNYSRTRPFKSLGIFARKKYGNSRLNYQFFRSKEVDEFKTILLRNAGNDSYRAMMRDGFMQSLLIGKMDVDYQAFEPAIVYLNGEYWGILNIREKINEHYPASNYGLDSDEIDMLETDQYLAHGTTVSGYGDHYADMLNYAMINDLSDQNHFEYVESQMDVNEFLNYWLVEIYFENFDWPTNNMKYWRPRTEGGRWRWVLYDTDFGWGAYSGDGNIIKYSTTIDEDWTILIRELLDNEGFRNEYYQRMAALIATVFDPERVSPIYDSIRIIMDAEIGRHNGKWDIPGTTTYNRHTTEIMPEFTLTRPLEMRGIMQDNFSLEGTYELSAEVSDPGMGFISACNLELPTGFSGAFFKNIPLRLEAVPMSGYRFSQWEGALNTSSSEIYLDASENTSIRAVFVQDSPVTGIFINELDASGRLTVQDDYKQANDWIEIYNDNDFEVDLAGCYLSDSSDFLEMYQVPYGMPQKTTVGAGEYLLFWCDGQSSQGALHTNFKLSKEGESLFLTHRQGDVLSIVDSVLYADQYNDVTYSRNPEADRWDYLMPTPGKRNYLIEQVNIQINEYLTRNEGNQRDEFNEADDWIELFNPTDDTIDLAGLFMTDSLQDPLKHRIPGGNPATLISPRGFKVLWADGQEDQGVLHLGFKLDGRSEQIGLYQVGAGILDSLSYLNEFSEISVGRLPDGSSSLQFLTATPGYENDVRQLEGLIINEFMARNAGSHFDEFGEYDDWIELYNDNDFPVDIGGAFMTDSLGDQFKHRIPVFEPDSTTIPAKGYLVLWADNQENQGVLHLGFKLSGDGEQIGISQANGLEYIDSLNYQEVFSNQALGILDYTTLEIEIVSQSPGTKNYLLPTGNLFISEIVASDNEIYQDEAGEYDDWIEIYNDNSYPVDIGGLYITDSIANPTKFRIRADRPDSTTINPKDRMILWADNQPGQGINHLGFKLSGKGEQLALNSQNGESIIDSLSFPDQYSYFSFSRQNDTGKWKFFRPTFGRSNLSLVIEGVRINEFMTSNTSLTDEYGEYDDLIELHNINEIPVDVGGMYLTDSLGDPTMYRIPSHSPELTTIPPKGYFVLYADDQSEQGVHHTNFRLSRNGEQIGLIHFDEETIIDSLTYQKQYKNTSIGRIGDDLAWTPVPPSPGVQNEIPDFSALVINEVMGSNNIIYMDEYNEYDDWIELYNGGSEPIDIGGIFISDSCGDPTQCRISSEFPDSTTILPQDYLVLWADGSKEEGILHMDLKIAKTGEIVFVYSQNGMLIDSVNYPFISPNLSWGRTADGDELWTLFHHPTPLRSNLLTKMNDFGMEKPIASLYPNPVTNQASFMLWLEDPGRIRIEIINLQGSVVSILQYDHSGTGKVNIDWDVSDASGNRLKEGLYLYRISFGTGLYTGKFLVQ